MFQKPPNIIAAKYSCFTVSKFPHTIKPVFKEHADHMTQCSELFHIFAILTLYSLMMPWGIITQWISDDVLRYYLVIIRYIQGGPEKTKPKLFKVIYPQTWPFSLSHLSLCVSFLERDLINDINNINECIMTSLDIVAIATICSQFRWYVSLWFNPYFMKFSSFGTLFIDHNVSQLFVKPQLTIAEIWFYWMFYDHFSARSLLAKLGRWGWWWAWWGWLERKARRH